MLNLMRLKSFVGMLGGKGSRAYYILGYSTEKMIFYYLDPHYVQKAEDPEYFSEVSYFKKKVYEFGYQDMNCNV